MVGRAHRQVNVRSGFRELLNIAKLTARPWPIRDRPMKGTQPGLFLFRVLRRPGTHRNAWKKSGQL